MRKFVDTLRLNFRSEPAAKNSNIIEVLRLGQPVSVLEGAGGDYVKITVETNGSHREGFVSEKYLRDPLSEGREALVQQVISEWERFNFGLGREHRDPYFKFIGEMWRRIGLNLDGKDRDVPWSAAAISFMVHNAGEAFPGTRYPKFRFAAAHSRYVHDSIKKRHARDENTPFWGFDLHERRPKIGDIVCRGRAGSDVDFEHATNHDSFKSHCDIIVRIKEETVVAIGGNVSHSVKRTEYDKTPDGFLDDTKNVYAILVNLHD
jgi:Uncharacterized protein conserved in bacteria (DUF2272)/Bacterial SH3 domain